MNKAIVLSLMLVAVALAGCADEPPSGAFIATNPSSSYSELTVSIVSTPEQNEYPASDPSGGQQECTADQATTGNEQLPQCREATSTITFGPEGGAVLPTADSNTGYTAWLIRGNGDDAVEFELGGFDDHGPVEGGNHYEYNGETVWDGEDFSDVSEVQIRFGETVVATALGTGDSFVLAESLEAIEASVNFTGNVINVALTGAPANAPLVAWLVDHDVDEETGEATGGKTHSVQFLLAGEQTSYTLTETEGIVADYEEFHIHVGASAINVAVSPINVALSD